MTKYRKTITAIAGAAISWGTLVLLSDPSAITGAEVAAGLGLLGTSLGVYTVRNA